MLCVLSMHESNWVTVQVIYGPCRLAEDAFVPNVRDIVKSIFDIAQEIPLESAASYRRLTSDSSGRSEAYLHLMLYQVWS